MSGDKDVGITSVEFYKTLFTQDQIVRYPGKNALRPFVEPLLRDIVETLNLLVTHDEIKKNIFSLNPNKASEPNSFNGFFFQNNKTIVGVTLLVQS